MEGAGTALGGIVGTGPRRERGSGRGEMEGEGSEDSEEEKGLIGERVEVGEGQGCATRGIENLIEEARRD